ncbi:triosephosphate isomerase [Lactobacillus selangorensis]|uniref:Triosephosphate isomerase n=2 Tax=Lactobacillus selangorensis TaxID=81857 RepID=A0A0R2FTJ1_9LACO|nr:triosephosphate isomerase [Lactobacillus selangorensis]KRN32006.1 triosephosphate isomerase [Lactobacillus selangorensis]
MAGNWKLNKDPQETAEFAQAITGKLPSDSEVISIIAAPAIDLQTLLDQKVPNLKVASENSYFEDDGAYTGETSPLALHEMGITYGIIGHSERRGYFKETDEDINKKAHALIKNQITPIICCGESLEKREAGKVDEWVSGQVTAALKGISANEVANLVIAYEPIWAIGTGKTATSDQAEEVCKMIRHTIEDLYDEGTANSVHILYGGSVKPANVKDLMSKEDIDGGLVGGASLDPESFLQLVHYQD